LIRGKVEIPGINVNPVGIRRLQIGQLDIRDATIQKIPDWAQSTPQAIPIYPPVTTQVGTPIVNIPGCVEAHRDSSENQNLKNEDREGTVTYCDAGTPSFTPIDYDKDNLDITQKSPPPPIIPPSKTPEQETPAQPGIPKRPTCQEGEKYNEAKKVCEIIVVEVPEKQIPWTEQYLPPLPLVTTTASIAVVATTSALLAKPLADLLLKVVKPVTKKVVKKIAAIRKKEIPVLSLSARRDEQRVRNQAIRTLKSALRQRKR
jgi:hypothetical protein